MKLTLFLLALGVVIYGATPQPIIFTSHSSDECTCPAYECSSRKMRTDTFLYEYTPFSAKVSGFGIRVNDLGYSADQPLQYEVMNKKNWQIMTEQTHSYESYVFSGSECDGLYLQMETNDQWYFRAICENEDGCELRMGVIPVSYSCSELLTKGECMKKAACGWCEGVNMTDRSACVPGNSDSPSYNIVCSHYYEFWGEYGWLFIVVLVFCCVCCCGGCICCYSRLTDNEVERNQRFANEMANMPIQFNNGPEEEVYTSQQGTFVQIPADFNPEDYSNKL